MNIKISKIKRLLDKNQIKYIDYSEYLSKNYNNKKPNIVIANTIKGKGVSFMEDDNNWHYRIPTKDEVELSKKELGLK